LHIRHFWILTGIKYYIPLLIGTCLKQLI